MSGVQVTQKQHTTMRRKAQAGRALHQSRTVSVLKALRSTLSKAGNDLFALPLATLGATQERVEGEDVIGIFNDDWLLIHLDGPNGLRGGAMIDPVLVGGLIQQQTMGKVTAALPGPDRAMTSTDAALVAPLIDALLTRAAALPDDESDRALLEGFRFGTCAKDSRLLALALDGPKYEVIRLTIDVAKGARQGELVFCLPHAFAAPEDAAEEGDADPDAPPRPAKTLARTVLSLPADLMVSLAQVSLPLGAASTLREGQVVDLGPVSFDRVQLRTRDGRVLSHGALGQVSGMRALRLSQRAKPRDHPQRRASDAEAVTASLPAAQDFEEMYTVEGLMRGQITAETEGATPDAGLPGAFEAERKDPEEMPEAPEDPDLYHGDQTHDTHRISEKETMQKVG